MTGEELPQPNLFDVAEELFQFIEDDDSSQEGDGDTVKILTVAHKSHNTGIVHELLVKQARIETIYRRNLRTLHTYSLWVDSLASGFGIDGNEEEFRRINAQTDPYVSLLLSYFADRYPIELNQSIPANN